MLEAQGELIVFTDADGSYGQRGGQVTAALAEAPVAIGSAAGRLGHRPTGPPVGQPAVQPGHPGPCSACRSVTPSAA